MFVGQDEAAVFILSIWAVSSLVILYSSQVEVFEKLDLPVQYETRGELVSQELITVLPSSQWEVEG